MSRYFTIIIILIYFCSCNSNLRIEKRKYNRGFYISTGKVKSKTTIGKSDTNIAILDVPFEYRDISLLSNSDSLYSEIGSDLELISCEKINLHKISNIQNNSKTKNKKLHYLLVSQKKNDTKIKEKQNKIWNLLFVLSILLILAVMLYIGLYLIYNPILFIAGGIEVGFIFLSLIGLAIVALFGKNFISVVIGKEKTKRKITFFILMSLMAIFIFAGSLYLFLSVNGFYFYFIPIAIIGFIFSFLIPIIAKRIAWGSTSEMNEEQKKEFYKAKKRVLTFGSILILVPLILTGLFFLAYNLGF